MLGYLIEFDKKNLGWSWSKWEYAPTFDGGKRVVRHGGGLEFMKIFPTLVAGNDTNATARPIRSVHNTEEIEVALKKHGVEYIFLYQGETVDENDFHTVEAAEAFYGLNKCAIWDLTAYWFGYNRNMNSWCMCDSFTGALEFTPASAERRMREFRASNRQFPAHNALSTERGGINYC